jgi:GAF domain-containing protein
VNEEGALRARVTSLEDERRRAFDEAQREADAMFAQYQLSQLLASGDDLEKLAPAVLAEIARTSGAEAAALWLAAPARRTLRRIASLEPADGSAAGEPGGGSELPVTFADSAAAGRWTASAGWFGVPLEESRALGVGAPRCGRSTRPQHGTVPARPATPRRLS